MLLFPFVGHVPKPVELIHAELGCPCAAVGFTPDGRFVLAAGSGQVAKFDLQSKKQTVKEHGAGRNGQSAFASDGNLLVSLNNPLADYRKVQLCRYDVAAGKSTVMREYPAGSASVDAAGRYVFLKGTSAKGNSESGITYIAPVQRPYDLIVWDGTAVTIDPDGKVA